MTDAMRAETVRVHGHDGDEIEAYFAQPLDNGPFGGVVVIHHMPGYDEGSKEITRRFASHGYLAICPNLYSREAREVAADKVVATVRARGGVPDDRLVGDVNGSLQFLNSLDGPGGFNGRAATIGYCSGGRQSFLAACRLKLDAAVDCYGAFVVNRPPEESGLKARPLVDIAGNLSCPLLGLFGADDRNPSPEETAELQRVLEKHGKTFEFHTYDGAGHAFFAVDRPAYRAEAATDGWQKIWDFFGRYMSR